MMLSRSVMSLTSAVFLLLNGCAANSGKKPYTPPKQVNQQLGTWDHDRIRQARETEAAMASNDIPDAISNTKNCVVMTGEEMSRARTTGCTPIDPRAGHGDNAYCCPGDSE